MVQSFETLLQQLAPDPWRSHAGFAPDIAQANEELYSASDELAATKVIREWLSRYQPCLFGRIAAKADMISFCILQEADLRGDRLALRDKIQTARTNWTKAGFEGRKSAFVILLVSKRLAEATPNETVKAIAAELCSLYLLREIEADQIYHDELFLEKPGTLRTAWKWLAGVNYFSAHGDGRWWQDHRIPGGIAFSINSVGHMAKSGQLSRALSYLDEVLEGPSEASGNEQVDSLEKALGLAMRTIGMASDAVSGKATYLLEQRPDDPLPPCPKDVPRSLVGTNYIEYGGWYHTDVTLPTIYFQPNVERPAGLQPVQLDFSYLFDNDAANPDYLTMGKGRRIRGSAVPHGYRMQRVIGESIAIRDHANLKQALGR